jgi:hypothetical protein
MYKIDKIIDTISQKYLYLKIKLQMHSFLDLVQEMLTKDEIEQSAIENEQKY